MSTHILLADIQKPFLQIRIKEEDRDAFRFLFNINGNEQHLRFARVPFGGESSPFLLGATLNYHYDQLPDKFNDTVQMLKENTYVDNLMKTGKNVEELENFKREATGILESAKFPVHKWESNVKSLEDEGSKNPSKILGLWDKKNDTLQVQVPTPNSKLITKREMLSHLGRVYDPLGFISPTTVKGKEIYRDACDQTRGWNTAVPDQIRMEWLKWTNQLTNVKIPRSLVKSVGRTKALHLHVFADASNTACSAVAIAVIEGTTQGLQIRQFGRILRQKY